MNVREGKEVGWGVDLLAFCGRVRYTIGGGSRNRLGGVFDVVGHVSSGCDMLYMIAVELYCSRRVF